jgi:hypothetical protein
MRRAGSSLVFGCILLLLSACGYAPTGQGPGTQTASPAQTGSPAPIAASSPVLSPSQWPRYDDATYKFSISYPPTFTFERQHGIAGSDILMLYRAVDPAYLKGYPPGEVEIGMYAKDADSLDAWVTKHSGPPSPTEDNRHWSAVTNRATVTVAGRDGISFDWSPDSGKSVIHSTCVFLGTTYVLMVAWWTTDAKYSDTIQHHHQQMLVDLRI